MKCHSEVGKLEEFLNSKRNEIDFVSDGEEQTLDDYFRLWKTVTEKLCAYREEGIVLDDEFVLRLYDYMNVVAKVYDMRTKQAQIVNDTWLRTYEMLAKVVK